jgi:cytochrome b
MPSIQFIREKVYDPILRILHLWIALAIVLLILTSQAADRVTLISTATVLWRLHVWMGYALILGLVARLCWALYGPKYANWRHLWTWRAWLAALRNRTLFTPPMRFGHHPLATAAYLTVYVTCFLLAVTGLALAAIEQGQGPFMPWLGHDLLLKSWFMLPHDLLGDVVLAFIVLHIAALILHERRHGIPLAQAMVSGYQYRKDDPE